MSDIAVVWNSDAGVLDLAIVDDDIATDGGLGTSVLLSLLLDRRASDEDVLPSGDDVRGWWGDQFAEIENDLQGSKLWLVERAKITAGLAGQIDGFARDALAWALEDRVAASVEAQTEIEGTAICLGTTITRPDGEALNFLFVPLWEVTLAV